MDKKQGILYIVFGAMTTAVNIGAFALLAAFWPYLLANAVAWVFAVAFAFFTNKVYVFRSRDFRRSVWLRELWEFFLARAATGIADFAGMYVLISLLCQNEILSKILLNIVVILANYILSCYWIFRNSRNKS